MHFYVMRNRRLVLLILISLLCYIFLQCTLYALSQRREFLSHNLRSRQSDQYYHSNGQEVLPVLYPLENVRDYVDICHQFGIQVILVDPNILRLAERPQQASNGTCQYFCEGNAVTMVTEVAVMSHLWQHDVSLLNRIKGKGFTVAFFTEKKVEAARFLSLGVKTEIYTHYLYERNGHTIHQVILYRRQPGYWWYAEFTGTEHPEAGDTMVMQTEYAQSVSYFGRHAGVLDNFEMVKVSMDGVRLRVPRYPSKILRALPDAKFIQCNYTRADIFHSKYSHREEEDSIRQFREANRHILTQAMTVLDGLGVRFWLSSGTCLGWYRQCDPIHYSGDVDIGVWISDYSKQLIPAMIHSGLSLKHVFGKISDSYELSFENSHVKLDIFFFYEEGDYMWNGGTQARTGQKFKYIFPKFTLCWTEFLGLKVRVPCETDQYLKANYGPDWFVPVESWDWKSSPPNVVENGYWPKEEWSQVIMIFDKV